MAPSFDLVSEPWIPCVRLDGTPDTLGLLDTLTQANKLREVVDASPLVTASLHRLLLAILHRNFGPRNFDAWRELWGAGRFDGEVLSDYFDDWGHRFDLFDEERPFYQTPGMPEKMLAPVAKLAHEAASGNNAALFDHRLDEQPRGVGPGTAAKWIIAHQAAAMGGIVSAQKGRGYAKAAPLTQGAVLLVSGETFAHTLILNMPRYDPENALPLPGGDQDPPAWERDEPAAVGERLPDGYVDYLTWQSRRIWVGPEEGGSVVRECIIGDGIRFPKDHSQRDPMMAYDETPESSDEPWSARSFGEERTLWEDSLAVFGSLVGADRQPDAVEEMARLVGEGVLSASALLDVDAYGLDSSRAKIDLWRHERQPLPLRYLGDDELVDSLHQCLELTEQVHKSLYGATRELAEEALTAGVRDADRDAVSRMVAALDVAGYYWSSLELPFRELIVDLAAEGTDRFEREAQWVALLRRTAWQAFGQAESGLAPNARSLRAISHARRVLGGSLKKKLADYEEVTAHAD